MSNDFCCIIKVTIFFLLRFFNNYYLYGWCLRPVLELVEVHTFADKTKIKEIFSASNRLYCISSVLWSMIRN